MSKPKMLNILKKSCGKSKAGLWLTEGPRAVARLLERWVGPQHLQKII